MIKIVFILVTSLFGLILLAKTTTNEKFSLQPAEEAIAEADFIASEADCKRHDRHCKKSFFIASDIFRKKTQKIVKKLYDSCEKDPEYCDDLAFIYELQGNFPSAIFAAHKYYIKFHRGSYPMLSYKHGKDKDTAFEKTIKDCRENGFECAQIVLIMRDHPQYAEAVTRLEANCKGPSGSDFNESFSCAIIGAHYYQQQNFKQAQEFWSASCKYDLLACLLIIGSEKSSVEQKNSALKFLCEYKGENFGDLNRTDWKEFCAQVKRDKTVPSGLVKIAKHLLNIYGNP